MSDKGVSESDVGLLGFWFDAEVAVMEATGHLKKKILG